MGSWIPIEEETGAVLRVVLVMGLSWTGLQGCIGCSI